MKEIFRAVYCEEVADLLKMLGLTEKVNEGTLFCSVCGTAITVVNFGAVTRKCGNLVLSCDRGDCYNEFIAN